MTMAMVNMKREAESEGYPVAAEPSHTQAYPYGLRLCLCDEDMAKLGMPLPAVGTRVLVQAIAEVVEARANKVQDGETEMSTELQITDMQLTPETKGKSAAATLWPSEE